MMTRPHLDSRMGEDTWSDNEDSDLDYDFEDTSSDIGRNSKLLPSNSGTYGFAGTSNIVIIGSNQSSQVDDNLGRNLDTDSSMLGPLRYSINQFDRTFQNQDDTNTTVDNDHSRSRVSINSKNGTFRLDDRSRVSMNTGSDIQNSGRGAAFAFS